MQQYKLICIYGFAIFAMFFGAGNLVFPLTIGYFSGDNWFLGFFGLFLTGIILPFLGLFVIKLHKGNYHKFFGEAGKISSFVLPLFTLSLLGSFGVVPRCITVAHGGIYSLFPNFDLMSFSVIFSIMTFIFCLRDQILVKVLGKFLSPLLLAVFILLLGIGVFTAPEASNFTEKSVSFKQGFLTGYQLMDLFAAFFFSAFIFKQLQKVMVEKDDKTIIIFAIKASLVGSFLLMVVYMGLVFLGAHYAHLLNDVTPEHYLPTIITNVMGSWAAAATACLMVLSCLTTAVALNNIYARYLCSQLKLRDNKFPLMLSITTSISFVISLFDFRSIAAFLAPTLEVSYPGLIALTIMSICFRNKHKGLKTWIFWIITISSIIYFGV